MIENIVFDTLNVIASLVVFGIISFKLIVKSDRFTWVECIGMGLLAAGCVMTIGPITFKPSPYDDWSGMIMRIGAAIYFVGRLTRHRLNNHLARKDAAKWRANR